MKKLFLIMVMTFLGISSLMGANNCLQFDGSNDYISVPDDASLDFTEFTIEMWVYRTSSSNVKLIGQTNADNAQQGFIFGITDDKLKLEVWHGSSPYTNVESSETIPVDEWVHLAMTWKNNDYLKGYINGIQVINNSTIDADITNSTLMIIGMAPWYNINENHFSGYMDEIRIWNDVRTETEIRQNMYHELSSTEITSETNLVSYYKFNETSGTTLADSKGSNTGTLNGMAGTEWATSAAIFGPKYCLDFDGTDDYVTVAYNSTLDFTEFTIEMWVYHTKSASDQKIIGNANAAYPRRGFCLGISDAEKLYPEVFNSGSNNITSSETIPLNEWVHIAMTWKKGDYSDGIKGYINGKQVISTSTVNTDMNSSNGWTIGAAPWFPEKYFEGKIDEIRIWNNVRTATEIRENMMKTLVGNESGLMAYYRFDEPDAATLYDLTGNGNNGTLTSMNGLTDGGVKYFV